MSEIKNYWWERSDLCYIDGELHFASKKISEFLRANRTPFYVYSPARMLSNVGRIEKVLQDHGLDFQLLYAVKANRNPELLRTLAAGSECGIDACSPREVVLAVECGFDASRISVTSTAVSDADWETYKDYDDILFNCDSISSIKRIAGNGYRSKIGIRINPSKGVGYNDNPLVKYAGQTATKFGIYEDRIDEAKEISHRSGLTISGLHIHAGSGFLNNAFESYESILEYMVRTTDTFNDLEYLNIGGGMGIPLTESDASFDLDRWAEIVARTVGKTGLKIYIEPGNHIVKDAGILVTRVIEVEQKGGTGFAFIDAGFNLLPEPAYYNLPVEPVPMMEPGVSESGMVTIAGNINESLDIFKRDHRISLAEDDYLILINAGAYGASMSSNHCLRSTAKEIIAKPSASKSENS